MTYFFVASCILHGMTQEKNSKNQTQPTAAQSGGQAQPITIQSGGQAQPTSSTKLDGQDSKTPKYGDEMTEVCGGV